MKAIELRGKEDLFLSMERTDPMPAPNEVVVRLKAAALNHRDVWIKRGTYAGLKYPIIPGSDGAGSVVATGEGVDEAKWMDREVVVNPGFEWGDERKAQSPDFKILGLPSDGTFAELIHVPVQNLYPKPEHLSFEEAAALPLAGLTAYRALFSQAKLRPSERVLISGIGGGVALMALVFAVARKAEVHVTSSSQEKIDLAVEMGATGGVSYRQEGWGAAYAKTAGAFDVVIDGAAGEGFNELVKAVAPGGRIVVYGATEGDPGAIAWRSVFWRQLKIIGSTMGSPEEFLEMLAFVNSNAIKPRVSAVYPLEKVGEAFRLMEEGKQFGKVVLSM